jgi:hypothetical protein
VFAPSEAIRGDGKEEQSAAPTKSHPHRPSCPQAVCADVRKALRGQRPEQENDEGAHGRVFYTAWRRPERFSRQGAKETAKDAKSSRNSLCGLGVLLGALA